MMVIIHCNIVIFLLTSGFHAQTLMAILKVKTPRHIFPVACA